LSIKVVIFKMKKLYLLLILSLIVTSSCSKDIKKISEIKENNQELEIINNYKEAYKALNDGDPFFASKKFLEAELLFPQSQWASRSALMASYSYYLQNYYSEALSNLERYLITYPNDKDIAYAHYLIAICYYEEIEDEKRDSRPLINAAEKFEFIVNNFPKTDFAIDAKFKLELIRDILASKEMYIGRHYLKQKKWIAAINRFKHVINEYDQTIFTEEALHRLVELNYNLGLLEESKKYANTLGYNYQSSKWYDKTYKIFNEDYEPKTIPPLKNDRKSVISKFKKLFE
jgi:outer membrane protein assembly factor BamD